MIILLFFTDAKISIVTDVDDMISYNATSAHRTNDLIMVENKPTVVH